MSNAAVVLTRRADTRTDTRRRTPCDDRQRRRLEWGTY